MVFPVYDREGQDHRYSIGLFLDWLENQYSLNLIYGIEDYLRDKDVNLFCFEGGSLNSPNAAEIHRNVLYDLISSERIDGLIILSATIAHYVDLEEISQFCEQYLPIPTISVALDFDPIPAVMVDNKSGMRELLVHLLEVHQFKRFAFINGPEANQDAQERFEVFKEILGEYGVVIDPHLVVSGNFTTESGKEAVCTLLDKCRSPFDVIIASSDDMALGAMEELHKRNIKIPDEIAVVGFDNLEISMYSSPPLTTVSQSMYDQGQKAAELIMDCLAGLEVPARVILPTKLITRESCGCISRVCLDAAAGEVRWQDNRFELEFPERKQELCTNILKKLDEFLCQYRNIDSGLLINEFLDAFYNSLTAGNALPFLKSCNNLLCRVLLSRDDVFFWQFVLSEIRRQLLPLLTERETLVFAEDLLHQVRVMIAEKIMLEEKFKNYTAAEGTKTLNYLREDLLVTMDEVQLMDILAKRLPEIGIRSCYLALFNEGKYEATEVSRLILAYNEQARIDTGKKGLFFSSAKLLPDDILSKHRRVTMLVVSLSLPHDQMGFLLFEMGPRDGRLYGALRRIICSTLQGALLLKKIRAQTAYLQAQRKRLTRILVDLRKAMSGFIQTMALTVELRDPYTAGHQRKVADLAKAIADELNLSQELSEGIRMAGIIHDLGKIYVPSEILNKPGKLKDIEFNLIKIHPEVAYDILKVIDFPWPIAAIILQHHERLDGSGYPLGLKKGEIMLEARILSVADVVEAMASHRPYRASLGIDIALEEISKYRGIRYDVDIVDACLNLFHNKGYTFRL